MRTQNSIFHIPLELTKLAKREVFGTSFFGANNVSDGPKRLFGCTVELNKLLELEMEDSLG